MTRPPIDGRESKTRENPLTSSWEGNRSVPQFLPFRGIRYELDALASGPSRNHDVTPVVAPPYDVIDDDLRAALAARHDHNAVRLVLPLDDGPNDRYVVAARAFRAWRDAGMLVTDGSARFYSYRMSFVDDEGRERTTLGVLGALGLEEPGRGILPHERTLPKAKSDRLSLLRATRSNLDPIWGLSLTGGLSTLLTPAGFALATCIDDEGVTHELFAIDDDATIARIRAAVAETPLVLADGHHRFETACNYRRELEAAGRSIGGADEIMAFVVELAEEQLWVQPIHRLVNGLAHEFDLRAALSATFALQERGAHTAEGVDHLGAEMRATNGLGLVDHRGLALLLARQEVLTPRLHDEPELLRSVAATAFEAGVAPAIPGATITYRNDARTVASLVDKGSAQAAILLNPVSVAQIRDAAFAGLRMPQKTTFFQPKPRTGLVFRSLDD